MKGKLYIFGIGGTGSRVLRSLAMLAASGVKMEAEAIVPIIIDPDHANADVTRAVEQLKRYQTIRESLTFDGSGSNRFFRPAFQQTVSDYRLRLNDTRNKRFREFIGFDTLSENNRALASILFSTHNLEAKMEVGFKGNPNIGSVVLNQFDESQDFDDFSNAFRPEDRIFIVSSIFGGTGASGFPLLLKKLRANNASVKNSKAISEAPIGAISVLPYFKVRPSDDSEIVSASFIGKTKAALQYYDRSVAGEHSSVNMMYYIGDRRNNIYENCEGGDNQKNNAHLVEFAAAQAIVDFMNIEDDNEVLKCEQDSLQRTYAPYAQFKEYGIEEDVETVLFSTLGPEVQRMLFAPMTQFLLMGKYMQERFPQNRRLVKRQPWVHSLGLKEAFWSSDFNTTLQGFLSGYIEWLAELADNDRSFAPYTLGVSGRRLYDIVNGKEASRGGIGWDRTPQGIDLMDARLNRNCGEPAKSAPKEQRFMELFFIVTQRLVKKKYQE